MNNIPVIMIIFGGSGDLAHRKLYPALFNLYEQGLIHDNFAVIATARRPWSHDFLRQQICDAVHETHVEVNENDLVAFASHFYYQSHDVTNIEHYETLKNLAQELDDRYSAQGNRIFYMAMAPKFFGTIAEHIKDQHLTSTGFKRIVVEKPFGRDLASAEELNKQITASFAEDDIFRIDHDVVQNHIFQIITLLAMPEPKDLTSQSIHAAKQKLLDSMVIPTEDEIARHFVRGQYLGSDVTFGYRQEPNVAADSNTETFVAGEVKFKKGPLADLPIYFRTGKEMREKKNRIDIVLKHMSNQYGKAHSNNISIIIDPQMQIFITINGKKINEPGIRRENLSYGFTSEDQKQVPDGYERLLHDVFVNDSTNFTHWSELKNYWKFIDHVEETWQKENENGQEPEQYLPYRMGPKSANKIFESATERWIYE